MDHEEAGRYWNANAEAWTQLARAGYDVYRDYLNTPAFLAMLPDIRGLYGIDIGCGEGHNTRQLARLGARLAAIDIAETFVRHAEEMEQQEPLGIDYRVASGLELPFPDDHFDFAAAFMSLMDMPELGRVLAEAHRVLKPGGFLQFSITHPCFDTHHHRNLRNEHGVTYAFEIGGYFRNLEGEISEWIFSTTPVEIRESFPKFKTPRFTHTLSQWLNLLVDLGFRLERIEEPCPSDEAVRLCPAVQDAQVFSYFLHVRVRKPGSAAGPA
jgi:ubiquinone/menaquinone biosynthesis C-methylase UbiE